MQGSDHAVDTATSGSTMFMASGCPNTSKKNHDIHKQTPLRMQCPHHLDF